MKRANFCKLIFISSTGEPDRGITASRMGSMGQYFSQIQKILWEIHISCKQQSFPIPLPDGLTETFLFKIL